MSRTHLHLFSDSTGETLQMVANAALAQFEGVDVVRHFWPMVRSRQHLERIVPELEKSLERHWRKSVASSRYPLWMRWAK